MERLQAGRIGAAGLRILSAVAAVALMAGCGPDQDTMVEEHEPAETTTMTARGVDDVSAAGERSGATGGRTRDDPAVGTNGHEMPPAGVLPASGERRERMLERGGALYAQHCAACHGDDGDARSPFAYLMNPRPRSFLDEPFKLYTTENFIPSDDDLMRTLKRGMPGSAMPPWDHLSDEDLTSLVAYVRELYRGPIVEELEQWVEDGELAPEALASAIADRTEPGPPLRVPPDPPYDDVRAFRGQRLYLESCASCHGADGRPVAETVQFDTKGYPVVPRSFVDGIFKGGSEGEQLYARIFKGMRGTPMPASDDLFTDDEIWDLIHYVQSFSRPGAQERAALRHELIRASSVDALPENPLSPAWGSVQSTYVALTPLWWIEDRVEGVIVQAVHDGSELALRLAWIDPTRDTGAVRIDAFRDGVAVQFSKMADPPFFMGSPGGHGQVAIWHWKGDRQESPMGSYEELTAAFPNTAVDRYAPAPNGNPDRPPWEVPLDADPEVFRAYLTGWAAGNIVSDPTLGGPAESLAAQGPGTLGARPPSDQTIRAEGAYERGVWYVQMGNALSALEWVDGDGAAPRAVRPGDAVPVALAVWDGSAGDRDGRKSFSRWQTLLIEE